MPTTLATAGDSRIEAEKDRVYFAADDRPCTFEQLLSAVTKHGWKPEVPLEKAREFFPNPDEGYGSDEPPEEGAEEDDVPKIHPRSKLAKLAQRALAKFAFDESKHKRDEGGKFSVGDAVRHAKNPHVQGKVVESHGDGTHTVKWERDQHSVLANAPPQRHHEGELQGNSNQHKIDRTLKTLTEASGAGDMNRVHDARRTLKHLGWKEPAKPDKTAPAGQPTATPPADTGEERRASWPVDRPPNTAAVRAGGPPAASARVPTAQAQPPTTAGAIASQPAVQRQAAGESPQDAAARQRFRQTQAAAPAGTFQGQPGQPPQAPTVMHHLAPKPAAAPAPAAGGAAPTQPVAMQMNQTGGDNRLATPAPAAAPVRGAKLQPHEIKPGLRILTNAHHGPEVGGGAEDTLAEGTIVGPPRNRQPGFHRVQMDSGTQHDIPHHFLSHAGPAKGTAAAPKTPHLYGGAAARKGPTKEDLSGRRQ